MAKKYPIIVIGEDGKETKKTYINRYKNKEVSHIGFAMILCSLILVSILFGYSLNIKKTDLSPINFSYGLFAGITLTIFLLSIIFSSYGEEKIIDLRIKEEIP